MRKIIHSQTDRKEEIKTQKRKKIRSQYKGNPNTLNPNVSSYAA